jgi:hypothetical protein
LYEYDHKIKAIKIIREDGYEYAQFEDINSFPYKLKWLILIIINLS